ESVYPSLCARPLHTRSIATGSVGALPSPTTTLPEMKIGWRSNCGAGKEFPGKLPVVGTPAFGLVGTDLPPPPLAGGPPPCCAKAKGVKKIARIATADRGEVDIIPPCRKVKLQLGTNAGQIPRMM